MRRTIFASLAVALIVAGSYVGASLGSGSELPPPSAWESETAPRIEELDRLIDVFDRRIATHRDPLDHTTLGGYLIDRAGLTGDVDDYRRAVSVLEGAIEIAPGHRGAMAKLAEASLALHRFDRTIELTALLLDLEPLDPSILLLHSDALAEIGAVDDARDALAQARRIVGDDPAITVRRAGLAHLRGDQEGAIDLSALAREEAIDRDLRGSSLAFYFLLQADLLTDAGRLDDAHRLASLAVGMSPGWPEAIAALAGTEAARGQFGTAIDLYSEALAHRPDDPDWLSARSALYAATGLHEESAEDLSVAVGILRAEDPVVYGRALARALADRNIFPDESLSLAAADFERRKDLIGSDTYAWALYRAGRHDQARDVIRPVIEAGIQDAEARFHAGMILVAAGEPDQGRALLQGVLETNPSFHPLLALEAAGMLMAVGG